MTEDLSGVERETPDRTLNHCPGHWALHLSGLEKLIWALWEFHPKRSWRQQGPGQIRQQIWNINGVFSVLLQNLGILSCKNRWFDEFFGSGPKILWPTLRFFYFPEFPGAFSHSSTTNIFCTSFCHHFSHLHHSWAVIWIDLVSRKTLLNLVLMTRHWYLALGTELATFSWYRWWLKYCEILIVLLCHYC